MTPRDNYGRASEQPALVTMPGAAATALPPVSGEGTNDVLRAWSQVMADHIRCIANAPK